jgi:hypothetical protein
LAAAVEVYCSSAKFESVAKTRALAAAAVALKKQPLDQIQAERIPPVR